MGEPKGAGVCIVGKGAGVCIVGKGAGVCIVCLILVRIERRRMGVWSVTMSDERK